MIVAVNQGRRHPLHREEDRPRLAQGLLNLMSLILLYMVAMPQPLVALFLLAVHHFFRHREVHLSS